MLDINFKKSIARSIITMVRYLRDEEEEGSKKYLELHNYFLNLMYCKRRKKDEKISDEEEKYVNYCNRRLCIYCQNALMNRKRKRLLDFCERVENHYLITVTYPPVENISRDTWKSMQKAFGKLWKHLKNEKFMVIQGWYSMETEFNEAAFTFNPHVNAIIQANDFLTGNQLEDEIKNIWHGFTRMNQLNVANAENIEDFVRFAKYMYKMDLKQYGKYYEGDIELPIVPLLDLNAFRSLYDSLYRIHLSREMGPGKPNLDEIYSGYADDTGERFSGN